MPDPKSTPARTDALDSPQAEGFHALTQPAHYSLGEQARRQLLGHVVARPWFDRATLQLLKTMMFPASRAWAAAAEADFDYQRFCEAVPMPVRLERREAMTKALQRTAELHATSRACETAWEQAFFGPDPATGPLSPTQLLAIERARLGARHAYNATRWSLRTWVPLNIGRARMAIETPEAVEAVYGGGLQAFDDRLAPPDVIPAIEQSHAFPAPAGRDYWLRFQSPSARLGDTVYAHVSEPQDTGPTTPTLICGHGICVDFDHWKGLIDETQTLVRRGFRIIRPEAAWHGRRTPRGRYAGERIVAAFPMGLLDALSGAVQEWAVLADWARRHSTGALIFGGSSLGAMTAQLAADRSYVWPERLRPDGMLLVTHTGDMAGAVLEGSLSNLWANAETVQSFGWSPDLARRYLRLVNPVNRMPMPAANIVSILGKRDVVLPFESGRQLVARWGVPQDNAFVWDRGHFSVPAMLFRDTRPLERITAIARR